MTRHHSRNATRWDGLPAPVRTYLTAPKVGLFATGAVVTDEGHDHVGYEQIEAWLTGPAGEYTYITEFLGAPPRKRARSTSFSTWRALSPARSSTCITGSLSMAR